MKIAILGGTGPEGFGLGFRWALAGHDILIGSRSPERAAAKAAELAAHLPADAGAISGDGNEAVAAAGDVVVLSVPYEAQAATLTGVASGLTGKVLVTVVAPTGAKKARVRRLPSGVSAAEEAQQQLGDEVAVVAAFQNVGAHHLLDADYELECDVLVCGARKADKEVVLGLCADAGLKGVNAGALQNATVAEGLTSLLIAVNIIYKVKSAGIRITGLPDDDE